MLQLVAMKLKWTFFFEIIIRDFLLVKESIVCIRDPVNNVEIYEFPVS